MGQVAQNDVALYRSQSYWASFTDQSDCSKSLNHPTLLIRAQNHPTLLISNLPLLSFLLREKVGVGGFGEAQGVRLVRCAQHGVVVARAVDAARDADVRETCARGGASSARTGAVRDAIVCGVDFATRRRRAAAATAGRPGEDADREGCVIKVFLFLGVYQIVEITKARDRSALTRRCFAARAWIRRRRLRGPP